MGVLFISQKRTSVFLIEKFMGVLFLSSKGRAKARLLVAKAHERVANARNDFQHKLSRQLIAWAAPTKTKR